MPALHDASATPSHYPVGDDLTDRLEGQITRRTRGQIRDLRIVLLDDRVILQGRSRTYHAKQLAQEAALDLAEDVPALVNEIVVC